MNSDIKQAVCSLGDVGALIDALEGSFCDGNIEGADRLCTVLKEVFASRYGKLKTLCNE